MNQKTGENTSRIIEPIMEVVNFKGDYYLFGVGLGATYQGATSIWGSSKEVSKYGYYEEEGERIIIEGGYLLFICRLILFSVLGYSLKTPRLFNWIFVSILCLNFMLVFNIYNSIFILFGLALVDRIYFLREIEFNKIPQNEIRKT